MRPAALLGVLLLCACPEPTLRVRVELPSALVDQRDQLTLTLSIYAPAADSGVDCEQIAFGEVTTAELRSARVYHQVLLPASELDAAPSVPRAGAKLALALGARSDELAAEDIELSQALLAGCEEVGPIERNAELALSTEETVEVELARARLLLAAVLVGEEAAPVEVDQVAADGTARREAGLPLRLRRALSGEGAAAAPATLRASLTDAAGVRSTQTVEGLGEVTLSLEVGVEGVFSVDARARYQRGAGIGAISGLAWRRLLDSDDGNALGDILIDDAQHDLHWHLPGPIGMVDQLTPATAGFVSVRKVVGAQPRETLLQTVAISPGAGGSLALSIPPAHSLMTDRTTFLGFVSTEVEGRRQNSIAIAAPPILDAPVLGPLPGWVVVSNGSEASAAWPLPPGLLGDPPPDPLPTFFEALNPAVSTGPCPGARSPLVTLPALLGMREHEAEVGTGIGLYWLLNQDAYQQGPAAELGFAATSLAGVGQSFCLGVDGEPHRLLELKLRLGDIRYFYDLGPGGVATLGQIGAIQAHDNLSGMLRSIRYASIEVGGELQIVAPALHNSEVELNTYAGTSSCYQAQEPPCFHFQYRETLAVLPIHQLPENVLIVPGHFLDPEVTSLAMFWLQLSRTSGDGRADLAELYMIPRDGSASAVGGLIECARGPCWIHAADVDEDGLDELLVSNFESDLGGARARARVIRFAPRP